MEVTQINHNSSQNLETNNIRVAYSNNNTAQANSAKSKIDYENTMMNIEDVKDFLFMLIGGGISKVPTVESKGTNFSRSA